METNLLGTLLMARSGRSTRTVLIADRLTLCPSREYSSILQRRKSHCWVGGFLVVLTLAKPVYLEGIRQKALRRFWDTQPFNDQSLRSLSLRTEQCDCHSADTLCAHTLLGLTHTWHLTGIKQVSKLYKKHAHAHAFGSYLMSDVGRVCQILTRL